MTWIVWASIIGLVLMVIAIFTSTMHTKKRNAELRTGKIDEEM